MNPWKQRSPQICIIELSWNVTWVQHTAETWHGFPFSASPGLLNQCQALSLLLTVRYSPYRLLTSWDILPSPIFATQQTERGRYQNIRYTFLLVACASNILSSRHASFPLCLQEVSLFCKLPLKWCLWETSGDLPALLHLPILPTLVLPLSSLPLWTSAPLLLTIYYKLFHTDELILHLLNHFYWIESCLEVDIFVGPLCLICFCNAHSANTGLEHKDPL